MERNNTQQWAQFKGIFRQNCDLIKIIPEQVRATLNQQQWWIDDQKYLIQNWKPVLKNMIQSSAEKIWLNGNNHVQIIKQIQHLNFVKLGQLYLAFNKIVNIEPLGYINYQSLELLDLRQNCISRINCLHRLSIQSFNHLRLQVNPVTEIKQFTRTNINSQSLDFLSLQHYFDQYPTSEDYSIVIKLSPKLIGQLSIRSGKRISQPKVQKMIEVRFPSIITYKSQQK